MDKLFSSSLLVAGRLLDGFVVLLALLLISSASVCQRVQPKRSGISGQGIDELFPLQKVVVRVGSLAIAWTPFLLGVTVKTFSAACYGLYLTPIWYVK
ncbi:hypothetical protein C7B82_07105 [Stenomitos frigidus ULC18]|uniref:Uncharacterized protein n=1 Tax=Stenomitos frigidus ULC18 TaxID=2107698 RepID=A0A2T1EFQ6_9CYAN|nr:hypothetical protein C7B82_07105 [Stenomitos frigidus ULC18]